MSSQVQGTGPGQVVFQEQWRPLQLTAVGSRHSGTCDKARFGSATLPALSLPAVLGGLAPALKGKALVALAQT